MEKSLLIWFLAVLPIVVCSINTIPLLDSVSFQSHTSQHQQTGEESKNLKRQNHQNHHFKMFEWDVEQPVDVLLNSDSHDADSHVWSIYIGTCSICLSRLIDM